MANSTAIKLNSCGLVLYVASTDCLHVVPRSARPWIHRLLLSVISAFSSIKIWRCVLTCNGQHLTVSPPYVSCAASDAARLHVRLFFSLWMLHWSSAVWTIVTVSCLTYPPSLSNDFSQCKMPQQGSFTIWDDATTLVMRLLVFIGFACHIVSPSRWRCRRTAYYTASGQFVKPFTNCVDGAALSRKQLTGRPNDRMLRRICVRRESATNTTLQYIADTLAWTSVLKLVSLSLLAETSRPLFSRPVWVWRCLSPRAMLFQFKCATTNKQMLTTVVTKTKKCPITILD